jgi:predicted transposase YdaD
VAYISSIQRIGIKEGRKEGRKEGMEEERRSLIRELLEEQVGPLTVELQAQVETLDLKQLKALGKALLKFSQVDDLKAWLARQA